jgi:hypothetical protein
LHILPTEAVSIRHYVETGAEGYGWTGPSVSLKIQKDRVGE